MSWRRCVQRTMVSVSASTRGCRRLARELPETNFIGARLPPRPRNATSGSRLAHMATAAPSRSSYGHWRDLVRELVSRDVKLRYRGSVLGMAWSQIGALVQIGTLTFVFSRVVRLGIPHHADRKSTRLNSSHPVISYAVLC